MKQDFWEELDKLAGYVHGRNKELVRIALLGRNQGLAAAEIASWLIAKGGSPQLKDKEVNRAVDAAFRLPDRASSPGNADRARSPLRAAPARPAPNAKQRAFVRTMIAAGGGTAALEELEKLSKGGSFLEKVFDPHALYFFGEKDTPRTRDCLHFPREFKDTPSFFGPNPYTGMPGKNAEGKESYAVKSCLSSRTLALIEFDELALEIQAAFWKGVIVKDMFDVVSLVFSGNKSIHGLIRLKPEDWEGQWDKLELLLASDPDPHYHIDTAARHVLMSRFPGHFRADKGRYQRLLYLG